MIPVKNMIAYALRQLKLNEKDYLTYDFEMATVVFSLSNWWHYLYGAKCEVFSDHHNLQDFITYKDLNMRQRRLMELLEDYDVTI